jgi:hypothetical protein
MGGILIGLTRGSVVRSARLRIQLEKGFKRNMTLDGSQCTLNLPKPGEGGEVYCDHTIWTLDNQ